MGGCRHSPQGQCKNRAQVRTTQFLTSLPRPCPVREEPRFQRSNRRSRGINSSPNKEGREKLMSDTQAKPTIIPADDMDAVLSVLKLLGVKVRIADWKDAETNEVWATHQDDADEQGGFRFTFK